MVRRVFGGRSGRSDELIPPYLQAPKLRAIDYAVERLGMTSFADLGGVWAVQAGYTFYALSRPGVRQGALVDTGITDDVRRRAARDSRLALIDGEFGDPEVAGRVGAIDAVLLFDVLLHQVAPDWDEILRLWAKTARTFIIVQPQLRDGNVPIRLLDLGPEEYARHVPADHIDVAWDRLDEVDPRYGKPFRDIHEYWQWGIPNASLRAAMERLGRHLYYYIDHGQWRDVAPFQNIAMVYSLP